MTNTIQAELAGVGAFGIRHLGDIREMNGAKVTSLVDRELEANLVVVRLAMTPAAIDADGSALQHIQLLHDH